jgi:hypothetical protein
MVVVKRAFAVASAIGLAACTALLGIDKDYQPQSADGGGEAGSKDVVVESGDEVTPDDAGFERSPCELPHSFCDDFDTNGLGIGWTGTSVGSMAKMSIDNAAFVSAPKSVAAETGNMDAAANDPKTEAKLVRMILGKWNRVVAEVDVRIDQAPQNQGLTVELMGVAMVAQSGNPNWHVTIHHWPGKMQIVEEHFGYADGGYDYIFNDIPQQLAIGKWTHMRVEIIPNNGKTHATVTIGGGKVFDQDLIETWGPDTKAELQIGTYAMYWGADHWAVRFDNAVMDVQ